MNQAHAVAIRHEKDRARIERRGLAPMKAVGIATRAAAIRAYRADNHPGHVIQAIRNSFRATVPLVTKAMVDGDLQGRLRSLMTAHDQRPRPLALSSPLEEATKFLESRLNVSDYGIRQLAATYGREATTATGRLSGILEEKVGTALAEAASRGLHVGGGIRLIQDAFDAAGVTNRNPYAIENLYRTQIQISYSAGRWNANKDEAIQEILWGYEFSAIEDNRTTEICQEMDGVRQPKNSATWLRLFAPLHWNCRSTCIEIFNGDSLATPTEVPNVVAMPGFGINFGNLFSDIISRIAG